MIGWRMRVNAGSEGLTGLRVSPCCSALFLASLNSSHGSCRLASLRVVLCRRFVFCSWNTATAPPHTRLGQYKFGALEVGISQLRAEFAVSVTLGNFFSFSLFLSLSLSHIATKNAGKAGMSGLDRFDAFRTSLSMLKRPSFSFFFFFSLFFSIGTETFFLLFGTCDCHTSSF